MNANPKIRRPRGAHAQGKRVTLKQVAEQAGVGLITASRVLREPEKVSSDLRQRVLEAMESLGYVANQVASGLASGASRVVPVIIPTLSHPVYVPFLHGVQQQLDRHGYETLLGTTEYVADKEADLVKTLLGWFPAGLLMSGTDHLPATRKRLQTAIAAGLPVIEFMDMSDSPLDMIVGFSHAAVGAAVAEYFADRNYRHIAYAGAQARHDRRSARRAESFAGVLRGRGLPDHYELRLDEPFSISLGGRLLAEMLERYPQVEAIFFANDELAAGAIFEAQRRGIRVPDRLAVMGFNDTAIASAICPTISSVAVDLHGMGCRAADLLLERLSGRAPECTRIDTGFRIIERDSTAGRERSMT